MAGGQSVGPPMAAIKVTLDGSDLTDKIAPRLISLQLTEKRDEAADELEIVLHDHDGRLAIPKEGAELDVAIGWKRGPSVKVGLVDKGKFKVDEVTWGGPPDTLTIKGRSADFTDGFRVRREKKWKATTIGAVLNEIAGANGMKASVDSSLASIEVKVLAQDNRSDSAMLRFLGKRHDAVATVKGKTLIFAPIGKGQTASGKSLPALSINRQSGDRYQWTRAAREDYGGVEARWHDQDTGERKTVKAGKGKGKPKRLKRTFHKEADAKHAAEAEHKRVQRAAASFELDLAFGDAGIYPEQKGRLAGFKESVDATDWLVSEVTHTLDGNGGFRTKLKLETAA